MTNYSSGHAAEKVAAEYRKRHGYDIVALNWKHPRAEIDIIARKKLGWRRYGPHVFFEVKYRKTDHQGRGLDYITPAKLKQMQFAANMYATLNDIADEYILGAVELSGTSDVPVIIENLY